MSTKAQAILDEIRALPLEEREEVLDEALRLRDTMRQWEAQKATLRQIQSRHAGRGLLKRLLEERAKERLGIKLNAPDCRTATSLVSTPSPG